MNGTLSINGLTIRSDIMIHNNFEVNNKETSSGVFNFVNLIYTNVFLVYHLKTSENLQFSVFREYTKGPLT